MKDFNHLGKGNFNTSLSGVERILALTKHCSEYHFCLVLENAIINLVLSGLWDLVQNTVGELLCINNSMASLLSVSIAYCSGRAGQIDPECRCSFFEKQAT